MQFDATDRILVPRRQLIAWGAIGLGLSWGSLSSATPSGEAHDLSCDEKTTELRRIKVVVESSGNLLVRPVVAQVNGKLVNQSEAPLRQVPFEANVTQLYDERIVKQTSELVQSLRYYRELDGKLSINKTTSIPSLAEERRWICARVDAQGRTYFAPQDPLKREELDLLDVAGNSLALHRLSPGKSVQIGETWTHENAVLENLLGIDKVIEQKEVQSKLLEVKENTAIIALSGAIVGSVKSVKSQLQLQAKYNIDLKSHQVTWFALGITEKRDVSASQPGFESTTRLRLATMPIETPEELADAQLEKFQLDDPLGGKVLTFESAKGGFRFMHDDRWYSMIDRADGSVLRLVDRGDLVAQCTITDLPMLSAGQRPSLGVLQSEVQTKLGKTFQTIVEANESTTETGLTLQRVVATALAEDVPVIWTYYLAIREDGRRVSLKFTHDASMTERFASADATIVSSLQLLDKAPASGPSAAIAPDSAGAKTSSLKSPVK